MKLMYWGGIALLASLSYAFDTQYGEPYRPQYHFTPAKNWMNDPNGLVFYKGEYHLFYQYNPFGNSWGHMSWGHAVSTDLVRWKHLPVALAEENGVMIFSGSAVVDRKNSSGLCRESSPGDASCLVAIYTGHTETRQTQHIAYSNDRGRTWTKFSGNPVIDLGMKDFRDPKVIWHEPTQRWVMVAALPAERKVRLFGSKDLKKWEALSDFGPAGATNGIWECPDMFPLAIEGELGKEAWVLVVNLNPGGPAGGSGSQYFVGSFDGVKFVNANPPETKLWIDHGKDFYAGVTFSDIPITDGRRVIIGWMSNWQYAGKEPTTPWRTAQTLPRSLGLRRTAGGLRLTQTPVAELESLREEVLSLENVSVAELNREIKARHAGGQSLEIELMLDMDSASEAGLEVLASEPERTVVAVDRVRGELFIDRTKSGDTTFAKPFAGRHAAPLRIADGLVSMRVFVDWSSVEAFAGGGEAAMTERVFPSRTNTGIRAYEKGGAVRVRAARIWRMRSVWN
jgi:fructan beta-fructosidase